MKATIEFDLEKDEEKEGFKMIWEGPRWKSACYEIAHKLRSLHKHGDYEHQETRELIEKVYTEIFWAELNDHGLDPYE